MKATRSGGCFSRLVEIVIVIVIGAFLLRWLFYNFILPLLPWMVGIGSAVGVVLLGAWFYSRAISR